MTLKHIGFYDSPVMRELARQAVENGTVSSQDVSFLIKKAKSKDIYAPSENVFDDMVRLADGLRNKGYVNEAKALEEKILNYKVAAHEFSKILDEAHPEGDVEVAKAKDDNGVVETIVGVHDLFMEQINKKPSAKNKMAASEFSPILDAAHPDGDVEVAEAKDDNGVVETIVSVHDLIMQKMNKKPSAKQAFVSNILKIAEGILKGGQNVADTKDHIYKIDKLNAISDEVNSTVEFAKQTITSVSTNVVLFTKDNVLYLIPLFTKYANLNSASVTQTLNLYMQVYRGQEDSAKTIYNNLAQQSPAQQKQYCSLVNVAIYDNLLNPDRESKLSLFNGPMQLGKELGKAIYRGYSNEELQQAAKAMHTYVLHLYEVTFGDAKLSEANKAVSEKIEAAKKSLLDEIAKAPTLPKLEYTATSNAPIIDGLNMIFNTFKQLSQNPEVNALIAEISGVDQSILSSLNLTAIANSLSSKISMAASLEISKADAVVSKATAEGIASTFGKTLNLVMELIKKDEENKQYLSFRDTLGAIYSGLKGVIDLFPVVTLSKLLGAVKKYLPSVNSLEGLQQTAIEWFEQTQRLTSTGSVDIGLKKEGQTQPIPLSNVSKPSGAKPSTKPGATPSNTKTTIPGPLSEEEKDAVKIMQGLLVEIGNKYNDPSLTHVGKDGSPKPDGAWGGGTGTILEKVKALMQKEKINLNLNTGTQGGKGQVTINKANENTRALKTFLGRKPSETSSAQNFQIGKIPGLNNVTVMTQDFASLNNLYDMFVRAGITPEVDDENVIGIPFYTFYNCMLTTYNTVKSWYEGNKKDFAGGYQIMNTRMKEFVNFSSANAFFDKGRANMLNPKGAVTKEALSGSSKQFTPVGVNSKSENKKVKDLGQTTLNDGTILQVESWLINGKPTKVYVGPKGERYYEQDNGEFVQLNAGNRGGNIDEGDDVSMGQTLKSPFTESDNINLKANRRYFSKTKDMLANSSGTKGGNYLYLSNFYGTSPETLAEQLFANSQTNINHRTLLNNFLNQLSKEITEALAIYQQKAAELEGENADDIARMWQKRISYLLSQNKSY